MTNAKRTEKLEELLGYVGHYSMAREALNGLAGETPEAKASGRAKAIAFLESPREQGGEALQITPTILDERLRDDVAGTYHARRGIALAHYTAHTDDIIAGLEDSQLTAMLVNIPGSKGLAPQYEAVAKAEKPLSDLYSIISTYSQKGQLTTEAERDTKEKLAGLSTKVQKAMLTHAGIAKQFTAVAMQTARQRVFNLTSDGVKKLAEEMFGFYQVEFARTLADAKIDPVDYARAKLTAYAHDKPNEAMELTAQISQVKRE